MGQIGALITGGIGSRIDGPYVRECTDRRRPQKENRRTARAVRVSALDESRAAG